MILRKKYELAKLEGNENEMKEIGQEMCRNELSNKIRSTANIDVILEQQKRLGNLNIDVDFAIQKQRLLNERDALMEDIEFWEQYEAELEHLIHKFFS